MSPPARERRPGKGGAKSRGGRNQGQDTPRGTARKAHGWDDGTAAPDEDWWAAVLEHVDAYAPKAAR